MDEDELPHCEDCDGRGWRWQAVYRPAAIQFRPEETPVLENIPRQRIQCPECRGTGRR